MYIRREPRNTMEEESANRLKQTSAGREIDAVEFQVEAN